MSFIYAIPHTPPPITRTPALDKIIQWKNARLCQKYQDITGTSTNVQDKVKAIQELAPELYAKIIRTGKSKQLYEMLTILLTRQRQA